LKRSYINNLDGIRALAVLIVLDAHAGFGHIVPGGFGVTVFFFLSGFLITTLLIAEYEKHQTISLKKFFLRRFFRLFPPLFISLILAYGLVAVGLLGGDISAGGVFYQLFYLANYQQIFGWGSSTPHGTGVLWSLAVEEHFYLLFPFLFWLMLNHLSKARIFLLLAALCLLILGWRYYLVLVEQVSSIRTYYATDTRIDSILFGCLLALRFNPLSIDQDQSSIPARHWVMLGTAGAVLLLTLLYRDPVFRETLRYSLQGLALTPFFYCAVAYSRAPIFVWLEISALKKLGVYSYVIYLTHHVVISSLEHQNYGLQPAVTLLIAFLLSTAAAALVDRYVDGYFQRLRARLH